MVSMWHKVAVVNELEQTQQNVTNFLDDLKKYLFDSQQLVSYGMTLIGIILIYVLSRFIIRISSKLVIRMMQTRERSPLKFDPRRTATIGKLINNLISYVVNFITILLILGQVGINLGPILAGAGVLGLAIGFGAQSLVKDVITGFFIIFEDQFAVGDVIQVDAVRGTVEQIGIRVTRLRSWTGEVHFIPNGNIKQVTNFSINNSLAIVDISIAYESDIDKTVELLQKTVDEIAGTNDNIVSEPKVLGIQSLGQSEVVIRTIAECKPNAQVEVQRLLFAHFKKQLDANGIEIPYPKTVTYFKGERGAI
ncbi:mechanosensitive ion channel family protein [Paenibacillus sp. FJAT-26967]|uniref:mechanosensitive ion channel family protein n=1 Tax=Paenibacillus sp. FJAT-26967 TaxID=1729690 RepID=UPI0008384C13|nr:mechanosensitive ion channel family protein [Paenibacillus sp. FJAT-26967]